MGMCKYFIFITVQQCFSILIYRMIDSRSTWPGENITSILCLILSCLDEAKIGVQEASYLQRARKRTTYIRPDIYTLRLQSPCLHPKIIKDHDKLIHARPNEDIQYTCTCSFIDFIHHSLIELVKLKQDSHLKLLLLILSYHAIIRFSITWCHRSNIGKLLLVRDN